MLRKQNPFHPAKPKRICLELTNYCNLNCPFCLVGQQNIKGSQSHNELIREKGMMDLELAKKSIVEAKQFGINEVMLAFQGEGLLYDRKDFVELIKQTKKVGLKALLFTNGLLLDPHYSTEIVRAGLDLMQFSVDGTTQEVYELNRAGGKFEKVFQNMKDMVQIVEREESGLKLKWQFIVMRNNEHQIEEAKELAKQIGITLVLKTFAESKPEWATHNPKYRRKLSSIVWCSDIYTAIYVYWNGDVVSCCYDLEGNEIVGNAKINTIAEVWNGEKYRLLRKRINQSFFNPGNRPEFCTNCLKYTSIKKSKINIAMSRIKYNLLQPFLK